MPRNKKLIVLMAAWGQRRARMASPMTGADDRDARLMYCAQALGRTVSSCSELGDPELERVIRALQRELRSSGQHQFPNRDRASREQVWKIRQLESHIGWSEVPERLEGFLRSKFQTDRPEALSFRQAWKCIEALFAVHARAEIKACKGNAYRVNKDELAAEVARQKEALRSWSPMATS